MRQENSPVSLMARSEPYMIGEEFHISLFADAKPFCIGTPHTILFKYQDKLRTELDVLLRQKIIAPVTEATEWCCAPLVVRLRKFQFIIVFTMN